MGSQPKVLSSNLDSMSMEPVGFNILDLPFNTEKPEFKFAHYQIN